MRAREGQPAAPGLLPALRAFVARQDGFDIGAMAPAVAERAVDNGLGPILARVARTSPPPASSPVADRILAADLTGRVLTAEKLDAIDDILVAAAEAACDPVLLKGCATALRYYDEPHLRTMGDLDLLVTPDQAPRLERGLRERGYRESPAMPPASRYQRHHHSVPLWNPGRGVWVEIHTGLYPPLSPLAADLRFSLAAIGSLLTRIDFRSHAPRVMTHELQLVYTCTRWAGSLRRQRGAFPMLDAALLLSSAGGTLDWERVRALVERSWGVSAVRLMLTYLDRWQLATLPRDTLRRLAEGDRFLNPALIDVLHRLFTRFVMESRQPGAFVTPRILRIVWSTLIAPAPPAVKLAVLPVNIVFPSGGVGRPALADPIRRMVSALRRSRAE